MNIPVEQKFLIITEPWLTKVGSTKDLKTLRKADFTFALQELRHKVYGDILTKDAVVNIKTMLLKSTIGFKPVREDLFRRLVWIESHLVN